MIQTWKQKEILQQPNWPADDLDPILNQIQSYPNLVSIKEIKSLKKHLSNVSQGEGFIIQGGDCAETFIDFNATMIENKLKVLLQMSAIIQYITQTNIIRIGRIAGQFFKPRTNEFEIRNNLKLPSYRGDGINSIEFSKEAREHNPKRLLQSYHQSAATMNLIRNLTMTGYAHINNIKSWNFSPLENTEYVKRYNMIAKQIQDILTFTHHGNNSLFPNLVYNTVFTSHEALVLDYESTFIAEENNKSYDCSGHMLWVGDRTRFVDSAHIEFVSQIENPIGIKVGPNINISDITLLCKKINPTNQHGKISFIIRLGINYIENLLPKLINEVEKQSLNVLWLCDPMHGNTILTDKGIKTRNFDTIKQEIELFFKIHNQHGTIPGGLHFELTGDSVTECIGGIKNIQHQDLDEYYQTACDPRLNNEQSLEMAFLTAELLQKRRHNSE